MPRGDVIIVDFPSPAGHSGREQIGTRPAVVLQSGGSAALLTTTIIIPFTGNLNANRFPYTIVVDPSPQNGLSTQSVLLIFQIRAISNSRIIRKVGTLEDVYLQQLIDELNILLGL
jgi:mRNA interferase MazF